MQQCNRWHPEDFILRNEMRPIKLTQYFFSDQIWSKLSVQSFEGTDPIPPDGEEISDKKANYWMLRTSLYSPAQVQDNLSKQSFQFIDNTVRI